MQGKRLEYNITIKCNITFECSHFVQFGCHSIVKSWWKGRYAMFGERVGGLQ